jgi:hypothetical protein
MRNDSMGTGADRSRGALLVALILVVGGCEEFVGGGAATGEAKGGPGGGTTTGTALECGRKFLNQSTSTATTSSYACAPGVTLSGTEYVGTLTAAAAGDVVVSMTNYSWYPFVAILRDTGTGVDPANCVTANFYGVRFTAAAGEKFYVVVDQDGGVPTMKFDATIECNAPTTESACADGFDNDADLKTDCADADCAAAAECQTGSCQAWGSLACGDTLVPGRTDAFGSTNEVSGYTCASDRTPSGTEYAYEFTSPVDQWVVFTGTDFGGYGMLFVLEDTGTGCNPNTCVAHNYYSVKFFAEAGKKYYLVLDGRTGSYSYRASVVCNPPAAETGKCADDVDDDGDALIDCADPDCKSDAACLGAACTAPTTIACGTSLLHGDTAGKTSAVPQYACLPTLPLGGGENVYKLGPLTSNGPVLVTLSNLTNYGVVSVMEDTGAGCNSLNCIAEDYYNVRFTGQKGKTYYVSVEPDISYGPSVAYDLSVVCNPPQRETGLCADGIDNDGDLEADCEDADCLSACSANTCTSSGTVTCATRLLPGSTAGAGTTDVIDAYTCYPSLATPAPERAYTFKPSKSGYVNFALSDESTYATVAVLEDASGTCTPASCTAFQYYSTLTQVQVGRTYYVVVDSDGSSAFDYKLSVVCDPPVNETPGVDCADNIDNDADFLIDCADPDCNCAP